MTIGERVKMRDRIEALDFLTHAREAKKKNSFEKHRIMQFWISWQGFTQMKPKTFRKKWFDFNLEEPDCDPIDSDKL